jgi:hypothetical protein
LSYGHAVVSLYSPASSEESDHVIAVPLPAADTSPSFPAVGQSHRGDSAWEQEPQEVFQSYCGTGRDDMDGKSFAKLCKDCDLFDRKLTVVDADIVFAKVVHKGQRRIDLDQFKDALRLTAEKKGIELAALLAKIVEVGGPQLHGTTTDTVRFHDDKNTYTGTHRHSLTESQAPSSKRLSTSGSSRSQSPETTRPSRPSLTKRSPSKDSSLIFSPMVSGYRDTFRAFCGAQPDMDGKGFAKLCKDCQILDKKFTCTDVDLLFAKVVNKGQRRINLRQFEEAVSQIAEKKGVEGSDVFEQIGRSGPPIFSGTQSDHIRFYDGRSGSPRPDSG